MVTMKQLAKKFQCDTTTVYRHYRRLKHDKGDRFTSHVTLKYGKLEFDSQAEYILQNTFKHNYNNINDIAKSIKTNNYNSTITHLHDEIKHLRKNNNTITKDKERIYKLLTNEQINNRQANEIIRTQQLKIANKTNPNNKTKNTHQNLKAQVHNLSLWKRLKLLL